MRTGALGTSALLLLLSSSAFAAAVPGSVEPGQVEKRFQAPPAPKALPPAVIPETAAPMPPEQASRIRFVLKRVELNGATVLSPDEVAPLWSDLVNHEISLADVYQLAEKVTALYGNRGYLLSRAFVPPQTITDGVVRLTAVEGYVDKVVFEGKAVDRPALFDYISARVRESRPLNAAVLERYVLLANDLPGTRAQVVLKPSPETTGAATLFMDVQHVRFDGMASLDNYGTEAIGPDQLFFEANGNSLLGLQDRTTLRVATTPSQTDELHYLFLGHAEVLGGEGTTLAVGFTQSSSKPGGDILRLLEVESRSQSVDLGISYPWVRSRSRNVTVKFGVDYRDSETRLLGQTQAKDKQYILRTSLIYDRADSWGGLNMLTATLSRGLVVANAEVQSKAGAAVDFTALMLHASRQQALGDRWSLLVRATGQAAGNPLPASELFGIGGEAVGRGYDPSEFVGDQGAGGSIDLQYRPEVEWITFMQTYAFVDGATVFHRRAVNEPESQSISSAGLGLQLATANSLAFSMEAAKPLRERASAADNDNWRLFGRVTARF